MNDKLSFGDVWATASAERRINKGVRLRSVVVLYRLATYAHRGRSLVRLLFFPVAVFYKIYTEFLLGIEFPATVQAGPGLRIYHGVGLVVHPRVCLGRGCLLRQGVTIGNKGEHSQDLPSIGDHVEFGAGATVIGPVRIGDHAIIGAGTVVTKDVPPHHTVVAAAPRMMARKT